MRMRPYMVALLATCQFLSSTVRADTDAAQPALETTEIGAGLYRIRAEVADSESERELGLMHRESLALNSGMLFVFERHQAYCFWMRNTPLPLSIAFIADDGTIVNIADMQPRSDDSHCAEKRVRFALEMPQGWFDQKGIKPGSRLTSGRYFKP